MPHPGAGDWNLIASDEASPLALEQPNTTVVLSDGEAAWFRDAHQKAATRTTRRTAPDRSATAPLD
jgi:allophanate hydrolase subunit 1